VSAMVFATFIGEKLPRLQGSAQLGYACLPDRRGLLLACQAPGHPRGLMAAPSCPAFPKQLGEGGRKFLTVPRVGLALP
jgi:hypothetical protein